jgi:hypothetical protein
MSLKKYAASITKNQETSGDDKFMKPPIDKTIGIKNGQYDKMNEKGYIPEETPITNGDVILGKVTPINDTTNSGKIFKDSSEQYKAHADGVVDRVYVGIKNQDGYETRKMLIRSERFPHIGDKFCLALDGTTEVLTSNGWKLLEHITKDDLVATLEQNTNHYHYANPIGIYAFDYDGEMISIKSESVSVDVTSDHDLYVKPEEKDTYSLIRADLMKKSKVTFKHNAVDSDGKELFEGCVNESVVDISESHTTYHYKGKVGCIEVPSHVFMIRQNNKVTWIGNCSRHGQKGTMGIGLESIDMPFTKHGIRPDIIMNPNAIPSRMTIGQLWECLMGKVGALKGMNMDGTAFEDYDIEKIKDMLEKLGYNRECEEYLYNGMTGKKIKSMIFIGPTYYQRLKHMVEDKIHCLTKDHSVMTYDGWVAIDKITSKHQIKVVSPTLMVEHAYVEPNQIYGFDSKPRKIITVFNPNGTIMQKITEEHRLYVAYDEFGNFELIKVSELLKDDGTLDCQVMLGGNGELIIGKFHYVSEILDVPVYCLSVPGERFIVRYDGENSDGGCGVWTGNSRARGPVTILTRSAPEGFVLVKPKSYDKDTASRRVWRQHIQIAGRSDFDF